MAGGDKRIRIDDDGLDRFTELPVNLREHILDCLSIKDAVATSVLSSKWRFCWTGLRKLVFDDEFWNLGKDSTVLEHARAIDRVLMRHSGPIREFTLFIPDLKGKRMDIDMWLHVLSNNGVQKIEIDAFDYKDGLFPIPLWHLSENCLHSTLTPLENLKSLTLRSIDICLSSDVLFTLYLMGSAPNLQNLTLHLDSRVWCDEDRKLQRDAAKLLKAEAKKPTSYNNLQTIKISGFVGLLHESLLIKLLQNRCQKLKSIIIER